MPLVSSYARTFLLAARSAPYLFRCAPPVPSRHQRADTRLGPRAQCSSIELLPQRCASAIPLSSAHSSSASARHLRSAAGTLEIRLHGRLPTGKSSVERARPVFVDLMTAGHGSTRCMKPVDMLAGVPRRAAARVGRAAGRWLRAVGGFRFQRIAPHRAVSQLTHAAPCCLVAHRCSDPAFPRGFPVSPSAILGGLLNDCWSRSPAMMSPRCLQL